MSQTAVLVNMVPSTHVREGITPGVTSAWGRASADPTRGAVLVDLVANYPLTNAELLEAAQQCGPPQSWYDEDHEGLY
jgi:hypothetical protein